MNIIIDVKRLIRQYISPLRRQPNRLKWLYSLISLQSVFDSFHKWRANYRYKVRVTSQIFALTYHLRLIFKTDIIIQSYVDSYVTIGNDNEETHWKAFGLEDENIFISFPLTGENTFSFDNSDFVVVAPADVDIVQLRGEIDKYKLADKIYSIKIAEV